MSYRNDGNNRKCLTAWLRIITTEIYPYVGS